MVKKSKQINAEELKGIGGWLILPAIGLIYSLIVILYDLTVSFEGGSTYFIFAFILDVIFLVIIILALVSFFNKSSSAPKLMIGMYCFGVFYSIITILLLFIYFGDSVESYSSLFGNSFIQILVSTIWSIYFLKSKRVKNTFVN